MKFPYYPGCTLKAQAKNFEISALTTCAYLGIELEELDKWNCCGTVYSLATDDLMKQVAPIRVLIRAMEKGQNELVTLCAMCYNTLARANLLVRADEEKMEKLNSFMDDEPDYDGSVRVLHLLQVLKDIIGFEIIMQKVVRPLKGLRVSPYYGCLLIRPKGVAIDDPRDPRILEDLLSALGTDVIGTPERATCCGSYLTIDRKEVVADNAYRIIMASVERGAELLVTSCPLCFFNLDSRQKEAKKLHPEMKQVPIVYFTQLMALAFGLEDSLGFESHYVDPRPVLKEKGLLGGS
ncbi:MAG: heterodisulfide reductase, subunit B [Thermoproteota archaeon]|nr:MAG: heterodisulfide reductase, subunit B [Candidatus Korarchaeota archaeon]